MSAGVRVGVELCELSSRILASRRPNKHRKSADLGSMASGTGTGGRQTADFKDFEVGAGPRADSGGNAEPPGISLTAPPPTKY